ncbi:MAG: hypothetical protein Unbinned4026contig1001_29 [Prokaryotic dsDNA virus sp.]|nr:MAG: hypothetical protein Unbinned4026contig1001_29 [Prokaryotic dsDNA virus sp.]|tara:strand:- start:26236 stop:26601 length:366 start_codon:yes stop_codon:yes gene_type:complete
MNQPDPTRCKFCNELVYWAEPAGMSRPVAFDAQPSSDGTWQLYRNSRGMFAKPSKDPAARLRTEHIVTCTMNQANEKQRKPEPVQQDMIGRDNKAEVRQALARSQGWQYVQFMDAIAGAKG